MCVAPTSVVPLPPLGLGCGLEPIPSLQAPECEQFWGSMNLHNSCFPFLFLCKKKIKK